MDKILFENSEVVVYMNTSDEMFIRNVRMPLVCVRVSCVSTGLIVTSAGSIMLPTSVNGLSAISVEPRYL